MSIGHEADPGFLAVNQQMTLFINPVVGYRYFPSGQHLLPSLFHWISNLCTYAYYLMMLTAVLSKPQS